MTETGRVQRREASSFQIQMKGEWTALLLESLTITPNEVQSEEDRVADEAASCFVNNVLVLSDGFFDKREEIPANDLN